MARTATMKAPVQQETIDKAVAKAVALGDIVNLRQIFGPISPLRTDSPEDIYAPKYAYMLPEADEAASRYFIEALKIAQRTEIQTHIHAQLEKKGPAQLPADLLIPLADNAVRLGKFGSASQTYELLLIRRRMQETFYSQADTALDAGDIQKGVRGYVIATRLDYDYAAFPEPLPASPRHHTQALILHAEYPARLENSVPLQPAEQFLTTALGYLLLDAEAAARLESRPPSVRIQFIAELVRQTDPHWDDFAKRYAESCAIVRSFGERLQKEASRAEAPAESLEEEIEKQQQDTDPRQIPARLIGRSIENGEWWQYLKELAYQHPAAALFVSRQLVGPDLEIIMPRYRSDSDLVKRLGLAKD
ncbi:MAG: hypothetical protein IT368_00670 [Candidatus Hydrogenedentes bacterium]|nr:hypothetical protein [Candidatus Hydrogenedentota bacterium]